MVLAWKARLVTSPSFLDERGRILLNVTTCSLAENLFSSTEERLFGNCKAPGTLKTYDSIIRKLENFASEQSVNVNLS